MKKSRWKSIQVHCLYPQWNWKQLQIFRQSVLFINLESLKNFRRFLADSRCPGSPLSARCRNTPSSMVTFSRFNNLKARSLKMPVGILLLWAVLPACTVTRVRDGMILVLCVIFSIQKIIWVHFLLHIWNHTCALHSAFWYLYIVLIPNDFQFKALIWIPLNPFCATNADTQKKFKKHMV